MFTGRRRRRLHREAAKGKVGDREEVKNAGCYGKSYKGVIGTRIAPFWVSSGRKGINGKGICRILGF